MANRRVGKGKEMEQSGGEKVESSKIGTEMKEKERGKVIRRGKEWEGVEY